VANGLNSRLRGVFKSRNRREDKAEGQAQGRDMADDRELLNATQPLSFAEFLDRMKDPAAADLVRNIKK
jgi:hypothetical protein